MNPVDSTTADESRNPRTVPPELTPLNPAPLPPFIPHGAPNFAWGSMTGEQLCKKIDECFEEMVTWRRYIFKIPSGKQGQAFVSELAKLFSSFGVANSMECIALKAAMVPPFLTLQKRPPSHQSKAKDHAFCIQRRLQLWGDCEMDKLIKEVRAIQSHLPPSSHDNKQTKSTARRFAKLMAEGKIRAATRLLDNSGDDRAGVPLGPNDTIETPEGSCTVRETLIKKHPPAQPCEPSTTLPPTNEALRLHPVLFESINAMVILL